MADVAYVSNIHIERIKGPLRVARLPGEAQPRLFQRTQRDREALRSGHVAFRCRVARIHDRLRRRRTGRLNARHLCRRAGCAQDQR